MPLRHLRHVPPPQDMSPQYLLWVGHTYQCPRPGAQCLRMISILKQRVSVRCKCINISARMSHSALFSEQPLSELTSRESSTVRGSYRYIGYRSQYIYEPSRRTTAVAVCEAMNVSELWSTLGQVKCDSVCGRCYAAVSPALGNGVTWSNNFRCLCTHGDGQQFGKSYIHY